MKKTLRHSFKNSEYPCRWKWEPFGIGHCVVNYPKYFVFFVSGLILQLKWPFIFSNPKLFYFCLFLLCFLVLLCHCFLNFLLLLFYSFLSLVVRPKKTKIPQQRNFGELDSRGGGAARYYPTYKSSGVVNFRLYVVDLRRRKTSTTTATKLANCSLAVGKFETLLKH